ncbi:MAG TPA: hypothetical protein VJ831_08230, partial [Jatrophihabitantaceae bacterium]|nr:hypothetical protein [Jatrophihabitantaceae bacterium]
MAPPADQLSHAEQVYAIKTWRYLRLAMVTVVVGLGVSIGFERSKAPGCFQHSISAYYYTPVQGFLVGALVAIGACLIALQGNTEAEDILLNLAGMFAPVVALVPTPGTGSCASVLGSTKDRDVNVANNVFALLAVGLVAIVVVGALVVRGFVRGLPPATPSVIGYAVSVAVWAVGVGVFEGDRHFFTRNAHYAAAILMFVCILLVVVLNAFAFKSKTDADSVRNRYMAIASAMLASVVVIAILAVTTDWQHWVLVLEAALIGLFALFWVVQT